MRRIVGFILIICLGTWFVPAGLSAKKSIKDFGDKPVVSDTIMENIFQLAPFYARIFDEYKADIYMKAKVNVVKSNMLLRYIPTIVRVDKNTDEYLVESLSEMHYTAPDIYNRKIKARVSTFERDHNFEELTYFLKMNVYSTSLLSDRLISPLDKESAKHYTYLLDSIAGSSDSLKYKILIVPKFRSTQLVSGYMWISDQIWTIRELELSWKYNMLDFTMKAIMGEEGTDEEFLPVFQDGKADFKFMGNHLNMHAKTWLKYTDVLYYKGEERRKSQKKHQHDLTEFYELVVDTTKTDNDMERFEELRPIPLEPGEDSLYHAFQLRRDTVEAERIEKEKKKTKSMEFWGQVGDMMVGSYDVNLSNVGTVTCSPLINPVMFSYSHSNGIAYKQEFKYSKLFPNENLLRITPRVGYNFTQKEWYLQGDINFQYWPQKQGAIELSAGKGNRIYSNIIVDRFQTMQDSTFNKLQGAELDCFNNIYLNLSHTLEPWNGLLVKVGASVYWRSLVDDNWKKLRDYMDQNGISRLKENGIRSEYNSFAPHLRIEWTPGMYYYMNGKRKMNVGSSLPTFILDYEHGIKGVMGSTDAHERIEFEMQHKIKLQQISTLGYRVGFGLFTKMDNFYFVDFANFARSNLPIGWNDEIGGTFQLLDSRWYNSSSRYYRGNISYETPFLLFRPFNRWLEKIQQERLYGGVLFMPNLHPYVELGYGIGTHIFDVGVFVSSINGEFDTVGFKFTFELFND